MGRQIIVRSGSTPLSTTPGFGFGLPQGSGVYKGTSGSAAGVITLTLPSAVIGLSFNAIHSHFIGNLQFNGIYPPSLELAPSGTDKFIYGAGGSAGVAGKSIISPSSSLGPLPQASPFVVVSCVSQSHWMIQQIGGTWVDEA